jgi:phosphinothricin acetyltransferase
MTLRVIYGPDTKDWFLEIAALDRMAWKDSVDGEFVPDGEHAWRVWTEYAFVGCVSNEYGDLLAGLVGFQTNQKGLHFLHKLFVLKSHRGLGLGSKLMDEYARFLDDELLSSIMTTSPQNNAMVKLSDDAGFTTVEEVRGYYRDSENRLLRVREPRKT